MSNLKDALHIPDTQGARDGRRIAIQRVGVRDVRYPLELQIGTTKVADGRGLGPRRRAARDARGTHMSRFVAWLDSLDGPIDAATLRRELAAMLERLGAAEGRIEARFPFFLRKRAPVSGVESLLEYQGRLIGETRWARRPCGSRSRCRSSRSARARRRSPTYGAHNQRSHVTIKVEPLQEIGWPELVRFAEDSASSEIWAMLKRADEKWVTERAYENPKFVEDMVRDVAIRLNADPRVGRYEVDVENFESIHAHSAVARIERL
jgi:GTP cyclohydrolase I